MTTPALPDAVSVTAWTVHNVTSTDRSPTVPWPWDDVRCGFHTGLVDAPPPPAAGIVLMDGRWWPMCAEGLANAFRYRRPYAEPAATDTEETP